MRRQHKKKLWIMGGIGVLTAVLYSIQYLLLLNSKVKALFVFAWLYLFSAIALALAPIYLRIGKDHTVNIPSSIARLHRYMLIAMPVLALLPIVIIIIQKYTLSLSILSQCVSAILCCALFVYDMTGRRYPALIIAGTNLLISFLRVFSTIELLYFLLYFLPPCISLLFLLLRNKYRFLHWIGLAISGMAILLVIAFSAGTSSFADFVIVLCSPLLYALGFWLEGDRVELRPAHTAPSAYPALEAYKKRISSTKQKG